MELNGNVSEVKISIGEVLVTIIAQLCRQVMFSVRRRLQLRVQSCGQHSICVKSRIYTLGRERHQPVF